MFNKKNVHNVMVSKSNKTDMIILAQSYGFYSNIAISFMNLVSECAHRLYVTKAYKWKEIMDSYKNIDNIKFKIEDCTHNNTIECKKPCVIKSKELTNKIKIAYKIRIDYNNYIVGYLTTDCHDPVIKNQDEAVLYRIMRWYGNDSIGLCCGDYKIDVVDNKLQVIKI